MSYEEIECPYCEHAYDLCHDDGAFYNEGQSEEEKCPNCEKHFLVHSSMSWNFNAEKAECLNDGNHSWVKAYSEANIKNHPDLGKREKCETCGRTRVLE
jgi:hypothetical protein